MTAKQRDMIDQVLRSAPFDLGGDVDVQRPILEQMLTSQPLPADVRTTPGDLGGTDPADPAVSPVFADLSGLPPLLIQAGSQEVLLDEADAALNRAARFVNDNTTQNAAA